MMASPSLSALDAGSLNVSTPPLFERMVSDDVQELKQYAKIIQAQNLRLAELERVNEDLEKRLERQAKEKMSLEAEINATDRAWAERFAQLETERDAWRGTVQAEQRKNASLREQVYRKDKELHRMLQRKYDGAPGGGGGGPNTRQPSVSGAVERMGDRMRGGSHPDNAQHDNPHHHKSPQDLLATRQTPEVKERRAMQGLLDFFGMY
jgi:hypothetical protein